MRSSPASSSPTRDQRTLRLVSPLAEVPQIYSPRSPKPEDEVYLPSASWATMEVGSSLSGWRITHSSSAPTTSRASRRSRLPSTTYFAGSLNGAWPEPWTWRYRMRYALLIAGGLMILMGCIWLLQGIGILPGSFMTGQMFWAVVGAAFLAVGGLVILAGFRLNGRR